LPLWGKKWFVKLGQENYVRVKNYPLQYKTLTKRPLPDKEIWDKKLEAIVKRRLSQGRGKPGSFPEWFKRREISSENKDVKFLE
jgi:hypothetical protein